MEDSPHSYNEHSWYVLHIDGRHVDRVHGPIRRATESSAARATGLECGKENREGNLVVARAKGKMALNAEGYNTGKPDIVRWWLLLHS